MKVRRGARFRSPRIRLCRYREAVKETLCFGWIDSTRYAVDHKRFTQVFTPHTNEAVSLAAQNVRVGRRNLES